MAVDKHILAGWVVVVIDDEPDSLEVASYILDSFGADVHVANHGEQGLALIHEIRPNFIISDLSMPVMDGWELMQNLQNDIATREIPVIALTAHAMLGDREKAIAAGFHNYLTKPLSPLTFIDDLLRLLRNIPQFSGQFPIKD